MTRLLTWSLIIIVLGLAITWMLSSTQSNPRPLPDPAKPTEPTLGERAGAATTSAVDHTLASGEKLAVEAKTASAKVAEQTTVVAVEVAEASKKIAAQAQTLAGDAATQVSAAAQQAAAQAGKIVEGLQAPAKDTAKP